MFLCKWRARKQISLHRDNKVVLYCIVNWEHRERKQRHWYVLLQMSTRTAFILNQNLIRLNRIGRLIQNRSCSETHSINNCDEVSMKWAINVKQCSRDRQCNKTFFYRFSATTTNREYKTVRRKRGKNDDRGSGEYKKAFKREGGREGRERERETDRQIDRQTDREADRQTETDRQTHRHTHTRACARTHARTRTQRERQTDRQRQTDTDRQTNRHRQTDRQTDDSNFVFYAVNHCGYIRAI